MEETRTGYIAKPFDVLFFRGNRSFDVGEWYTEGLFPPLPSTFQGFVRTGILSVHGHLDKDSKLVNEKEALELVGDDEHLPFSIEGPYLYDNTPWFQASLDIVCEKENDTKILCRQVHLSQNRVASSLPVPFYFADENPKAHFLYSNSSFISVDDLNTFRKEGRFHITNPSPLFETEDHSGITIAYKDSKNEKTKISKQGQFYMTQYIRLKKECGFYFSIPQSLGSLENYTGRLGSEARGVFVQKSDTLVRKSLTLNESFYRQLAEEGQCKIILLTPGIFTSGWLPFPWEIKEKKCLLTTSFQNTVGTQHPLSTYQPQHLELFYLKSQRPLCISGFSKRRHKKQNGERHLGVKDQVITVPAGSVYYIKWDKKQADSADIANWLKQIDGTDIPHTPYSLMGYNQFVIGRIL